MSTAGSSCVDVFLACHRAITGRQLIRRSNSSDKEFHFQNRFAARLAEASIVHDQSGRNSYPDFTLVHQAEGYELKGLAWPGREATYDANSQVPSGIHNGRVVFYVFGRYPAKVTEDEYPVIDLIVCHGDFLNAAHNYVHKNRSVRGFGSYGDIMIRDRKMYVSPTPYALLSGATGQRTLVVPSAIEIDDRLAAVGQLARQETDRLVIGYEFDLLTNARSPHYAPNPDSGKLHRFTAYRVPGEEAPAVALTNSGAKGLGDGDADEE